MSRMRAMKTVLKMRLRSPDWKRFLEDLPALDGAAAIGPLFSLLSQGGELTCRAAVALGIVTAGMAEKDREAGRKVLRRLMWQMNEESGNIGWGVPEAFAEILVRSPALAGEFHRVLLSYILDTKGEDNFCEHGILRRSCFWAVGRLAQVAPDLCLPVFGALVAGLRDEDIPCRGMAAWALSFLPPRFEIVPLLRQLAVAKLHASCSIFDGTELLTLSVSEAARRTLDRSWPRAEQVEGKEEIVREASREQDSLR